MVTFISFETWDLQKTINEGVDGSRKFTEDSRNHVDIRGHQLHVSQGGEDEDQGIGGPREEPNTQQADASQPQFLKIKL